MKGAEPGVHTPGGGWRELGWQEGAGGADDTRCQAPSSVQLDRAYWGGS